MRFDLKVLSHLAKTLTEDMALFHVTRVRFTCRNGETFSIARAEDENAMLRPCNYVRFREYTAGVDGSRSEEATDDNTSVKPEDYSPVALSLMWTEDSYPTGTIVQLSEITSWFVDTMEPYKDTTVAAQHLAELMNEAVQWACAHTRTEVEDD